MATTSEPKPIPQEVEFKEEFVSRYKALLDDRYDEYIKFSTAYIRKCIRVNTLKASVEDIKRRLSPKWELTPIPWCKEGFWIKSKGEERFDIGNLVEHQLGYLYIQESASMIPPIVLDPQPGERVVDLCSAPGSKTTQIAMYMENQGTLVANDVDWSRLKPLGINLQRCGITNTVSFLKANNKLKKESFDRVLVDAPCSGTGTIRRSLKTMRMWSPGLIKRMAREQRKLIQLGYDLLKPGGTLVYSTCTQEPEENEAVVTALLNHNEGASLEKIQLDIVRSPAIEEFDGKRYHPKIENCLRIYPQDNDSEGFFVAKIKKPGNVITAGSENY
jgi:NOL1/NOP2/sun family putative RNA methylase